MYERTQVHIPLSNRIFGTGSILMSPTLNKKVRGDTNFP